MALENHISLCLDFIWCI